MAGKRNVEESPVCSVKKDVSKEDILNLLRERKVAMDDVDKKYHDAYNTLTHSYLEKLVPEALGGTVFELKEEFKKDNRRQVLRDRMWLCHARLIHFVNADGTIDNNLLVMVHGWFMDGVNCVMWDKRGISLDKFREMYVKSENQEYIKPEAEDEQNSN